MIADCIRRDLAEVGRGLERIGAEHGKCLACHCYREVADELLGSLEIVQGHAQLFEGGIAPHLPAEGERLRRLLDSSEGKHG